jgi:golgi phosphoprotein 3
MELNLVDQLTLLALDDKKGRMISEDIAFSYATAGAVILELALEQRIDLSENKVKIINREKTGDRIIDHYLEVLFRSKKERKVKDWVERLGEKAGKIKKDTFEKLVDKRILEKKEGKFLWVFSYNTYPTQNPKPENRLRDRLYDIIVNNRRPDLKEVMLLNLIESCNLGKEVFGKENAKIFKRKIKNSNEYESIAGSVNKSVKEIIETVNALLVIMITTATVTR